MKRTVLSAVLTSTILLSGCAYVQQFFQSDSAQESSAAFSAMRAEQEKQIKAEYGEEGGKYMDYQEGVIGNGRVSILFFYQAGDPDSEKHDAALREWYGVNYIPLPVYKVDFNTSADLNSRYDVKQQNTFVRVDGSGNVQVFKSFPNDLDLLQMLRP